MDIISKCKPCLRAIASAFGTFGVSKPNFNVTCENRGEIGVMGTEVRDRAYEAQLIAAYPVHPEYPAFCIEPLRVLRTRRSP